MPTSYIGFIQLDTDLLGLYVVTILVVIAVSCLAWLAHQTRLTKRQAILEAQEAELLARQHIQFDPKRSVLTRGSLQTTIPAGTLEYHLCKAVFGEPDEYHSDLNVLQDAGMDGFENRAAYQASRRINDKAKERLELKDDLLKRSNRKTILNKKYV